MQGTTRRGTGLCTHRVDHGSATAAVMGCDGGSGSGSVRARGTRTRGRAQVTKLGARWRVGYGNGGARALAVKWLTAGEAQARMQGMGGLKTGAQREMKAWNENERGPPFYKTVLGN